MGIISRYNKKIVYFVFYYVLTIYQVQQPSDNARSDYDVTIHSLFGSMQDC